VLLREGVLAEEIEPAAFDALAGMTLAAPKPPRQPARKLEAARERKRGRVAELEARLAEAKTALRDAERTVRKAHGDYERAERRVAQLAKQLETASD
jgi:hypothetical protein